MALKISGGKLEDIERILMYCPAMRSTTDVVVPWKNRRRRIKEATITINDGTVNVDLFVDCKTSPPYTRERLGAFSDSFLEDTYSVVYEGYDTAPCCCGRYLELTFDIDSSGLYLRVESDPTLFDNHGFNIEALFCQPLEEPAEIAKLLCRAEGYGPKPDYVGW